MRAKTFFIVSAACALGASCSEPEETGPIPADAPSVLLVTLDTTRADHLGSYGYEAARTPNLDALAGGGARFERAYAHVPLTLPSHATLMSGVHPAGTGLHVNFQGAVSEEVPLLAEMFAASGYRTGAFIAAWVLNGEFGLDRGFQTYDDIEGDPEDIGQQVERSADEITDATLAWLARDPKARFFAWVHYFDAHDPYEPPAEYAQGPTAYDGELAFIDAQFGRILGWLDDQDRRESTLVIVTADHGEGLGDHSEATHGVFIYDSTLHVPLIVSWPGKLESRVVSSIVGLVDLHPTIVELCGAQSSGLVEGHSLASPLMGGPFAAAPVYAESEYPLRSFGWAPLAAVRTGSWKFIEAPRSELYATGDDPGELNDLSAARSETGLSLRSALRELRSSWTVREAVGIELGKDASASLAALGYVEGAGDVSGIDLQTLSDPKDMAHVFSGTMRAKVMHDEERYADVVATLSPLVIDSPESDEIWALLGTSLFHLGRYAEARDAMQNSLRVRPDLPGRLTTLGDSFMALGKLEEALESFSQAEAADPDDAQIQSRLGVAYARSKRFAESERHYRRQCELSPTSPNAHTNLANILFSLSRFDEGLRSLDEAIELDATCKPAWMGKLQVYIARGRAEEARAALRACLQALPNDAQLHGVLRALVQTSADPELLEILDAHLAK